MAFGILETDPTLTPPPGTALLEDIQNTDQGNTTAALCLVPQPSDDPKDPLNWSRWKKELTYATILVGAIGAGVVGPILVPAFSLIVVKLQITLTQVSLLNGSLVMAQGVSSYLCTILAPIYGRRLNFLVCAVLQVAASVWGGASQSYNSLLAARIFQGVSYNDMSQLV